MIGFLKYCYENDSGFQAWADNQLTAPEHAHILGKITGRQIPEQQQVSGKEQKPQPTKARAKVKARIIPDKLPNTGDVQEGAPISDLLRIWDVEKILGISRSTIYRKERKGEFPSRVRIGDNSVAWREDDIRAWLESRPRGMA
ncbi:Prophage CP4-57 regulatory protein (AlpA) [compost metagenome]